MVDGEVDKDGDDSEVGEVDKDGDDSEVGAAGVVVDVIAAVGEVDEVVDDGVVGVDEVIEGNHSPFDFGSYGKTSA